MSTFTPALAPSVSNKRFKPRILVAQFGDGYVQRASDGINATLISVELTFNNLTKSEAQDISDFFETRLGTTSFTYTLPDEDSARTFICEQWDVQPKTADLANLTATFREVPDL